MFFNIALGLGAITLVQAAGYFFKLNKSLVAGACTLIIMAGMWFGIKAAREEAIRENSLSKNQSELLKSRQF